MEIILIALISAILTSALPFIDGILTSIVPISLYSEKYMGTMLGNTNFDAIFKLSFDFGVSLIVLKFVKKIFDFYITWLDGDPTEEPLTLLSNFLRAMIVAIGSSTLYEWLATVVEEFTNEMLSTIGVDMNPDFATIINSVSSAGIFNGIITLIFFICFFIMYLQFLKRGVEMLVLRIGLPIACVGLMDSDKGVFGSYIKKFFQSTLTIIVQICLVKFSIGLMLNSHVFWGIATMSLALKTPRFLQEFILTSGSGISPSSLYQGVQTTSAVVKSLSKIVK